MEQYIQLLIINLDDSKDLQERAKILIDLGIGSIYCGERWLFDAEQIYQLSKPENKDFPGIIDRIHAHDAELRKKTIEKLSKIDKVVDMHIFGQYKRMIGIKYGIPGSEALQGLDASSGIHS